MVSVIIATYNRSVLLTQCLRSLEKQEYKDFEVIVVDDGSTEDIESVVKQFHYKYIKSKKVGIPKAFNIGLDKARGKYITYVGSDDEFTPDFLSKEVAFLDSHSKIDIVYSDYSGCNVDNTASRWDIKHITYQNTKKAYQELLTRQTIPHGGSMWRRKAIKSIRYDETLDSAVDWELILTAVEKGYKFGHIKEPLLILKEGGYVREEHSERQIRCCKIILARRGMKYEYSK